MPHYWEHVLRVWGQPDLDTLIKFADQVNLDRVVSQITVPFLICHGANDRQTPLEYAHRSYDQATASPHRELRIFTREEGGAHRRFGPLRNRPEAAMGGRAKAFTAFSRHLSS